jgi:hypothetical protein
MGRFFLCLCVLCIQKGARKHFLSTHSMSYI